MTLSPLARLVFIVALLICGRNETDGVVADTQLRRDCFDIEDLETYKSQIFEVGLFRRIDESTFEIPSYLKHNWSRAHIEKNRADKVEAGKKGGRTSADNRVNQRAVAETQAPATPDALAGAQGSGEPTTQHSTEHDNTESPSVTPKRDRETRPFQNEFDDLWRIYLRKNDKAGAYGAFVARRRAGVSFEDLMTSTRNYMATQVGRDLKYIKHAKTFLGTTGDWSEFIEATSPTSIQQVAETIPISDEELMAELQRDKDMAAQR